MHILVLYQYFQSPDAPGTGRHYSFVAEWVKKHRVSVVCSSSSFTDPVTAKFPDAPDHVELHRIPVRYANRMGIIQRFQAYQNFARKTVRLAKQIDRPDVVFATSTPLSVGWAARKVARHWDIPWVFEVRDLWPDFPIQMGAIPTKALQSRLRAFERRLYHDADHVIALSSDMESHILHNGGSRHSTSTLVNGTSFELLDATDPSAARRLRTDYGLGDKTVVLYAGTLGRANGIPEILSVTERLRERKDIVFVFVGAGYHDQMVANAAADQENVIHVAPRPKHEMYAWHQMADLSLVTFIDKPVLRTNSPSKFFDSLSCGTPVLTTNPGWTRRFVLDHDCGWSVDALDSSVLSDEILRAVSSRAELVRRGENGARIARQSFDRREMAQRLDEIFSKLVDSREANGAVPVA